MSLIDFTLQNGLEIQRQQLAALRMKLNDACYSDLVQWVKEQNAKLEEDADGFEVTRGALLDEFVANWVPCGLSPREMMDALTVITSDPKIAGWLRENDPKALVQCQVALGLK